MFEERSRNGCLLSFGDVGFPLMVESLHARPHVLRVLAVRTGHAPERRHGRTNGILVLHGVQAPSGHCPILPGAAQVPLRQSQSVTAGP